jgi:hypothetical protein
MLTGSTYGTLDFWTHLVDNQVRTTHGLTNAYPDLYFDLELT